MTELDLTEIQQLVSSLVDEQSNPIFARVSAAIDPEAITHTALTADQAYIVPLADSANPNTRTTGRFSQEINQSFAIIIAVRATNDRLGADVNDRLRTYKWAVRNALCGYDTTGTVDEISLVEGQVVAFTAGGVYWMDTYTTNYIQEQTP